MRRESHRRPQCHPTLRIWLGRSPRNVDGWEDMVDAEVGVHATPRAGTSCVVRVRELVVIHESISDHLGATHSPRNFWILSARAKLEFARTTQLKALTMISWSLMSVFLAVEFAFVPCFRRHVS